MHTHFIFLFLLLLAISSFPLLADNFRLRVHTQTLSLLTEEDIHAEIHFGKTVAARLLGQYPPYDNKALTRYVNLVGQALVLNSPRQDITFHFSIVNSNTINAYSTPGGYVFITTQAIKTMQDESELAAVLAHEIAHITEKHIVNEFKIKGKDDSITSGITRIVGGSKDSATVAFQNAVDKAVDLLLSRGFKHDDELGSDQVAVTLLAQTGYDTMALERYLRRVIKATEEDDRKKSNTHPTTDLRLDTLNEYQKSSDLILHFPQGKKRFQAITSNNL